MDTPNTRQTDSRTGLWAGSPPCPGPHNGPSPQCGGEHSSLVRRKMERLICKGSSKSAFYSLMTGGLPTLRHPPHGWHFLHNYLNLERKGLGGRAVFWGPHSLRVSVSVFFCLVNQKALRVCRIHANWALSWGFPDSSDYRDFFPPEYRKKAALFRIYFGKHDFWAFSSVILSKWYLNTSKRGVWDTEERVDDKILLFYL